MITELILHGIYVPIVVGTAMVLYLLATRLLLPALRGEVRDPKRYLIGFGTAQLVLADNVENAWYGVGRIFHLTWILTSALPVALLGKLLLLGGVATLLAALLDAEPSHGARAAAALIVTCWLAGMLLAWIVWARAMSDRPRIPYGPGDVAAFLVLTGPGYSVRTVKLDRAAAELYAAEHGGIVERLVLPADAWHTSTAAEPAAFQAPPD